MTASGVRAATGSMSSASPESAGSAPSSPKKPSHSVASQENQAPVPKPSTPASTQRSIPSRSSPPAGQAGEIIGDYALGETIGKGTFGKVKLGLHLLTGEKVAVKILEKKRIVELADVERVAREIKILKRNRHVNVIQLFEVIDSPERIFLIMEYVDSGEMFEYIVAHHRIHEQEAVVLFQQIVDGLEYLHANEVTHRDLKPENLLLQTCGAMPTRLLVKIVDFGLSNTHDGGRLLRTACGSPCYAAPEMIQGKLYKGPLADIWSLGVVLFAMVCGYLPFEDSNTNMLYKKILSADYKLPPFLSHAVQDLIRRILETNPEKRYTVEMIRQHPWFTSARAVPRGISLSDKGDDPCVRDHILGQLATVGLDPDAVVDALMHKAHNALTAAYYLLYNKLLRLMKDQPQQQQPVPRPVPHETSNGTRRRPEATVPDEVRTTGVRKEPVSITAPASTTASTAAAQPSATVAELAAATQRRRVSDVSPHPTVVTRTPSHGPQASPRSAAPSSQAAALVKRPSSVRSGRNLVFITNGGVAPTVGGHSVASPSPTSGPQRPHAPPSMTVRPPSQSGSRVSVSNGMVALAPLFPQMQKRAPHSDTPSTGSRRHTIVEPKGSPSSPTSHASQALIRRRVTHGAAQVGTSSVASPSPPPTHSSPHPPATKEDDTRVAVAHTTAPQRIPPHRPSAAPSSSTVTPQFTQIL